MATIMIPTTHRSTFENTPAADSDDEKAASTKARKGSFSFMDALSPWSTRSQMISDASAGADNKEARACTALVEEVFRPQKAATTGEAAFLPRLLDRVNLSMWSQTQPKTLNSDIQSLRGQQSAAAKLLEEIEKETDQINQRLLKKRQLAKLQGNTGFFGHACTNCGPSLDANEINMQAAKPVGDDTVELRPMLRSRVKECEEALVERDAELRQLRHEIQMLRCEKEMIRQAEKDTVLDGPVNTKTSLVQRYGAAFSLVDGSHMKVAFLSWHQHVRRRALREKMLKTTSLALASDSARQKSLIFASWQTLVRAKRDAQKQKQDRQRLTIGQSYAAKFVMQADSTTMRAIVIEWWRVSKESALRAHVAVAQAQRDAAIKDTTALTPHGSTQKQGAATDKACCTLM